MFNGLYAGASAMQNLEKQHLITSTNLAHVNTTGYRKGTFATDQRSGEFRNLLTVPGADTVHQIDFKSQGRFEKTDRKLDLAIQGESFFQFQGENGIVYSKNGSLAVSTEGVLTNQIGLPLVGADGPITIPPEISARDLNISQEGVISSKGQTIGQIELVEFIDPQQLESESQVDFLIGNAQLKDEASGRILQGHRELANTNPVSELVNLIVASRQLEAAQRAVRSISDVIEQAIRE